MLYSQQSLVTLDDLKEHLSIEDTDNDAQMMQLLMWATRFIENATRQPQSPVTATLNIRPYSSSVLRFPYAVQSITSVTYDGKAISSSDYDLSPLLGPPYYRLTLKATSDVVFDSSKVATIAAVWGLKTDDAIRMAIILMVSRAVNEAYDDGLTAISTDFATRQFNREKRTTPMVEEIIASHKTPVLTL